MNTTIANRIWIEDPTEEVVYWVKENLKFPNPEYEKKQRMGLWLGRTPKELRLYEWDGNKLILPFGVIRDIMPLLKGTAVYCDFRQDSVINYGSKDMGLYDYQKHAVIRMLEEKYGILKAKPGSGKTQMGIAMIKAIRRRALWLCHTADLLNQSKERAERYIDPQLIGTITEGKVNVGAGVTFATVQTMANLELQQYRDYWDVVIVDECFPGDTVITTRDGFKQIKDITECDNVLTISDDGKLEYRVVKTVFTKIPGSLLKIILHDRTTLYCTSNHPILTKEGYKRADELADNDEVCCLRRNDGYFRFKAANALEHIARKKSRFLFGKMQEASQKRVDGKTQRTVTTTYDKNESRESIGKDEETQSDARFGNTGTYGRNLAGDETQTKGAWREWNRGNETSDCYDGSIKGTYSTFRVSRANKDSKGERISNKLQVGHRRSGTQTRNRNRWLFPLCLRKAGEGQEEGFITKFVGVDSIEIQKPTSDGTYGGLCEDGYVYNLEVEGNHNYFANGVNVHNCHRVSASATTFTRYEKVLNHLSARHKYGLSATPERSDGLIRATFALLGKMVYEVPDSAVADRTMGVRIRKIDTGIEIDDECLNVDGTINYVKLIGYLAGNEQRNKMIAYEIMEKKGHSCLILSDRLEQLKTIISMLPEQMREECAYVDGKMQSKKAKAEREQAIEDMRNGKKKYLFASYSLAKEGMDIPRLDRLFLASPCKFSAIVTQSVGRVQRTFEGKETPIVFDFVDDIGFCQGAYKKRCGSYRKIGAVIERG